MKKACGYKSLDGTIYESRYDCVKADDLFRARELRDTLTPIRRKITDIIRVNDDTIGRVMSYSVASTGEQKQEESSSYINYLKKCNAERVSSILCDLVITAMPELKLLEKEYNNNENKAESLEKNRTHLINFLKTALW